MWSYVGRLRRADVGRRIGYPCLSEIVHSRVFSRLILRIMRFSAYSLNVIIGREIELKSMQLYMLMFIGGGGRGRNVGNSR